MIVSLRPLNLKGSTESTDGASKINVPATGPPDKKSRIIPRKLHLIYIHTVKNKGNTVVTMGY